ALIPRTMLLVGQCLVGLASINAASADAAWGESSGSSPDRRYELPCYAGGNRIRQCLQAEFKVADPDPDMPALAPRVSQLQYFSDIASFRVLSLSNGKRTYHAFLLKRPPPATDFPIV